MAVVHSKMVLIDGEVSEKRWEVDFNAARQILGGGSWVVERPKLLQQDLDEMHQRLPKWILIATNSTSEAFCPDCGGWIVPRDGGFRCVQCDRDYPIRFVQNLAWTGPLTINVTGSQAVIEHIRMLRDNDRLKLEFFDQKDSQKFYSFFRVFYPMRWPEEPPKAFYHKVFFDTIMSGNPGRGHSTHLLDGYELCMYGFGEWRHSTIYRIVRDRVAIHALAQVKIANGERPERWFN